jgi:plasmid stabilization system protein ParE
VRALDELPVVALARIADALELLRSFPRTGRFHAESGFYAMTVALRRRRWSYRIVYRFHGDVIVVHFIEPGWRTPPR